MFIGAKAVAFGRIFLLLSATAFAQLVLAQDAPEFHSGVNLVLMDVSVTTNKGVPVAALTRSQFELKENGNAKEIVRFEPGSANISVVLVTDYSGSMTPRRDALFRGVTALLAQLGSEDEGALIAFNEQVDLVSEFATFDQPRDWLQRLAARPTTGKTALYDAIGAASRRLASSMNERRVIIVLSDGDDTASKASLRDILNEVSSSNRLVYTVGLFKAGEPDTNASALKQLAEITGGTATFDADGRHLPEVFTAIMKDLRSRYLLGFYAQSPAAAGKVEVRRLSVSARDAQRRSLRVRGRREYRIEGEK